MINKEFFKQLDVVAQEKNMEVDQILDAFSKGLANAYKKENKGAHVRVDIRKEKNEIRMFACKIVVDNFEDFDPLCEREPITLAEARTHKMNAKVGDSFDVQVNIKDLGRLAVGQLKQVLTQNIKTYEKENLTARYAMFKDEMLSLRVVAVLEKFLKLELDEKTTCVIPLTQLLPGEVYNVGDKIDVYISKIDQEKRGSSIVCTRIDPKLIVRLLEKYVPEVADGTVEIKGIARDAGRLTKICVFSNNDRVDAIGSVVGEGGRRINDVISNLNGERIELFKYSDDPKTLIINALRPATVSGIAEIDTERKTCTVVVPDDQVSLAIGKKGSNIRLFLESTGWKAIDIKSESAAYDLGLTW